MKQIAVIITVHNRKEKTIACLSRLHAQEVPEGYCIEVYLTDDGCTDGTPEAVRKQFPSVNIIGGDGNLYWNRGMYVAWDAASKTKDYDYYLWLNDDTYAYPDMLTLLLRASEHYDDKAIIVGATQDATHTKTTYGGYVKGKQSNITPTGNIQELYTFNGNIVLVPKSVFNVLGNLDYTFRHMCGDTDYGLRACKAGIRTFLAGEFLGECERHENPEKWCDDRIPLRKRLEYLYMPTGMNPSEHFYFERKHFGFIVSAFHFFTIYFRCFFPSIWNWLKK